MVARRRLVFVTRVAGILAAAAGLLGFTGTYFLVPGFLPEYPAGLLWCGVLALAGGVLVGAERIERSLRSARFATYGALAVGLVAIGVLVQTGVVLRLWVQAVVRFS